MKRWLAPLLCLIPLVAGAMTLRSGHDDSSPETRAMQDDDDANPGFLWVKQGESLWAQADGTSGKSCASCHGGADTALSGAAARYPAFDAARRRVVTLEQRINLCRTDHMGAQPLAWDDDRLLALTALVGLRSRGLPLAVTPVEPAYSLGERLFRQRMGQLNLSCAQCHDERAGMRLGGALIPQGHPNGYPLYRLEWQGMGSLYRRLRNCMIGVRSEPFPPDGVEATALSLFLAVRAKGLRVETPAVRP